MGSSDKCGLSAENAPPEQARPLLEQALRDPSDRVRRDARRALDELGR